MECDMLYGDESYLPFKLLRKEEIVMLKERDHKWYVESHNQLTNGVIFEWVQAHGLVESDAQTSIECDDGQSRSMWSCKHSLITELRSSGIAGLNYTVWVAEGMGKARAPTFLNKRKKKKPAA